jgi:hypothetical protein
MFAQSCVDPLTTLGWMLAVDAELSPSRARSSRKSRLGSGNSKRRLGLRELRIIEGCLTGRHQSVVLRAASNGVNDPKPWLSLRDARCTYQPRTSFVTGGREIVAPSVDSRSPSALLSSADTGIGSLRQPAVTSGSSELRLGLASPLPISLKPIEYRAGFQAPRKPLCAVAQCGSVLCPLLPCGKRTTSGLNQSSVFVNRKMQFWRL